MLWKERYEECADNVTPRLPLNYVIILLNGNALSIHLPVLENITSIGSVRIVTNMGNTKILHYLAWLTSCVTNPG